MAMILPEEDAVSVLLIVDILADELPAVYPGEDTSSIHLIILPRTGVLAEITPLIHAVALNVVVNELTGVV